MNMRILLGGLLCLASVHFSHAQTAVDSVVVSGQVLHLSARLYRQSPTVSVSRTNILRGGTDQAFVAPLQTDGRFRVAVPIIYPLEEMAFQVGNATTAFLATAGGVTINIDNDSLYVAAVPFRFGGVNAQVNQQFAQYKAFEAGQQVGKEATRKRAIQRALSGSPADIFSNLNTLFVSALTSFSATQSVFPLVSSWVQANARYDASAYVFDKATENAQTINGSLIATMLAGMPNLMTPARAIALGRFGLYATSTITRNESLNTRSIKIRTITNLLLRYGQDLTADDRQRLAVFAQTNSARQSELRYFSRLIERNPDTLTRLIQYENMLSAARSLFDSASLDFLKGHTLAVAVPTLRIDLVNVLGQHIRPQLADPRMQQSFDDLLALALRDTALVHQARTTYLALDRKGATGIVADGITINTGSFKDGSDLVQRAIDRNRNKVIYVILWQPDDEARLQLAQDAQRLRDVFSPDELTLLYVYPNSTDDKLWLESVVRNRLRGEHIRLTERQTLEATPVLNLFDPSPVRLFTPKSKQDRKEALLPDQFDKLVAQIRQLLQ